MEDEIQKYLKIALDSNVSLYYRKDALRRLGHLRKSAQLTKAIVKVLNDAGDPSLQKEAMDLAAQFCLTESVNFLLPISAGKGVNARHALNVLAKIGGIEAYNYLKEVASASGFDLSKTTAKRAIEDLLRREPQLAKQSNSGSFLMDEAKGTTAKVLPAAQSSSSESDYKQDLDKLATELSELQHKYDALQKETVDQAAETKKLQALKNNNSESTIVISELKKQLHELRREWLTVKAVHENKLTLLEERLEKDRKDLLKLKAKVTFAKPAKKSGCLTLVLILAFMTWFIFSKISCSRN